MMNEKLKRTADLCYEKHKLLGTYEFNKEKFAELIIQECAAIADVYSEPGAEWSGGAEICQQFGVKQSSIWGEL